MSLIAAHGILRAYKEMGYDAIGLSRHDLLAGYDFFKKKSLAELPFVTANVYNKSGQHAFKPHIIKKVGAFTFGIIGLTGPRLEELDTLVIEDWRKPLEEEINKLRSQCDSIIVLSSLSEKENRLLYKMFPELNIVIAAHSNSTNSPATLIGQTLTAQIGKQGKYLGQLDITWQGNYPWGNKRPGKEETLKNKLKTINWYIDEFSKQNNATDSPENNDKVSKLKASRKKLAEEIAALQSEPQKTTEKKYNSYNSRILPVYPQVTPLHIQNIVEEILDSINSYNKQKQLRLKSTSQPVAKELLSGKIAGYKICSSCHEQQYLFWKSTQHAASFETLLDRGQAYNLSCLPCHVTGGMITASSTENLRENLLLLEEGRLTVGCETCHGPAKHHARYPSQEMPNNRSMSKEVCTSCHTPERDHNFSYVSKLAKVQCPSK